MRIAMLLLLVLTACANVTTTKISRTRGGDLRIDSGKDVTIGALTFEDGGGTRLTLKGYSSAANTAVISAQGTREVDLTNAIADAVLKAVAAGAGVAAP